MSDVKERATRFLMSWQGSRYETKEIITDLLTELERVEGELNYCRNQWIEDEVAKAGLVARQQAAMECVEIAERKDCPHD